MTCGVSSMRMRIALQYVQAPSQPRILFTLRALPNTRICLFGSCSNLKQLFIPTSFYSSEYSYRGVCKLLLTISLLN